MTTPLYIKTPVLYQRALAALSEFYAVSEMKAMYTITQGPVYVSLNPKPPKRFSILKTILTCLK